MALRDRYDWVVLGDHPSALFSGCLASHLGYSVLFLPLVPSSKAFVAQNGQLFDPETNFLLGLGRGEHSHGLLAECLSQMGGLPEPLIRRGNSVLPQVHTPRSRISYVMDNDLFFREIEREWGHDVARRSGLVAGLSAAEPMALSYWRDFPNFLTRDPEKGWLKGSSDGARLRDHLRTRLTTKPPKGDSRPWLTSGSDVRALERRLDRADVGDFCSGAWFAVNGVEAEDPMLPDLVHALGLARTAAAFRGGQTAFRAHLLALATRLGGFVVEDSECRRIFVEDDRVIGVQMSQRGKMIGVSAAVLGCALDHARPFLTFSGRNRTAGLKAAPIASGWRFTLALTVHEEAIPPGMGARMIWKERQAPVLEIEVADPVDYDLGHPEERLIFARTILPCTKEAIEPEALRLVSARMFRQLSEVFPFLEYHVVNLYPDFRDTEQGAEGFSEAYGFVEPAMLPDNLRCYEGVGVGCESGIEGLYVCSAESFPALGSFGASVAAIETATRFARRAGGHGDRPFEKLWEFLK